MRALKRIRDLQDVALLMEWKIFWTIMIFLEIEDLLGNYNILEDVSIWHKSSLFHRN